MRGLRQVTSPHRQRSVRRRLSLRVREDHEMTSVVSWPQIEAVICSIRQVQCCVWRTQCADQQKRACCGGACLCKHCLSVFSCTQGRLAGLGVGLCIHIVVSLQKIALIEVACVKCVFVSCHQGVRSLALSWCLRGSLTV